MTIWKILTILSVVSVVLTNAGTARYGEKNRLLDFYSTSPRTCSLNGQLGKCRFVWDCYKTGGTNLGLCRLDTSMYGSCCAPNPNSPEDGWTQMPTMIPDETTLLPASSPVPDLVEEEQFILLPEVTLAQIEANKTTTTSTTTTTTTTESPSIPSSSSLASVESESASEEEEVVVETTTMMPSSRETEHKDDYMFRPSQCGIVHRMSSKTLRIIGGQDATFAAWPWVASIRRSSLFGYSSTHSCGGVLLNENWVATAAHCVAALSKSLIRVRLGEFNFKDDNEELPYVERRIEKKIVHPDYNFTSYENDLALVKLSTPVEFSLHIGPLCLPKNLNDSLVGQNASIVGWGRLSEGGKYSQLLQFVQVPIISNEECVKMFKSAGRMEMIPENFMCAGYKQGGRDGCQGDSGGPLQIRGPEDRWFLAGVMSWGIGCGEPNSPGVYTRISKFTEWILQNASI